MFQGQVACTRDRSHSQFAVANWLNEASPHPEPLLSTTDKSGRGFYHDATGRLLCPVDYDWLDVSYVPLVRLSVSCDY